jgi:CAAX protease family protein
METSKVSGQATTAASSSLRQVMRKHPLLFFFVMAYAFSWIMALPYVLSSWGIVKGDYTLLFDLEQWAGPALAAIIMTGITQGKAGLRRLRNRAKQGRAGWQWYLLILLGAPALLLLGIVVQPGMLASFHGLTNILLVSYPLYFVVVFFGAGLPEEIGWRGFALPRMQPRYGPLWGTLLLGVVWGFWHALFFLTPDHGGGPGTSFATLLINFSLFLVMIIALAIIFTWVFNHTHGSVFIASLLHTSIDTPQLVWIPLFLGLTEARLDLALLIGFGIPALIIVILTRGRLGYQPGEDRGGREQEGQQAGLPAGKAEQPLLV